MESMIGRRIEFCGDRGTVRYYGPIMHEPDKSKATGNWLGVEWDNPERGKHNGTVNGYKYFECSKTGGSLIKVEKANFGIPLPQAAKGKYKKYEEMSEDEKQQENQVEQEMYVQTTKKDKKLTVTLVGKDKAYAKFSEIENLREVALQCMNISSVDDGTEFLRNNFKSLEILHLDGNLLYSWEQYFQILWQLPKLNTISLTDNKFIKPSVEFLASLPKEKLIHPSLRVVSFIGMNLNWDDIDILSPSFEQLKELWLCRNNCSIIGTKYKIRLEYLQNLEMLNLENNSIQIWEDIMPFGALPKLTNLVLTSNDIKQIPEILGFNEITYLSLEKNQIDSWESINNISKLPKLNHLRISDNPLETKYGKLVIRYQIIARFKSLEVLNSSKIRPADRRDAELSYIKNAWEEFAKIAGSPENAADPLKRDEYMKKHHPRWAELVKHYGSPIDFSASAAKEVQNNLESRCVSITLRSMCKNSVHKPEVNKKLPETMTIGALKGLCAKLFGVDILKQRLSYHQDTFYICFTKMVVGLFHMIWMTI